MSEIQILVVEDESIVAEDIRRTLQAMGYSVPITVSSGEEAIKKVEEIKPDLVLMDIVLQGEMDGVETARQITSRSNTPVIYLTAYSDKTTLERAKITDPFGYIIKPFKEKELKMAITIALFKHEAEEVLRASENKYRTLIENAPQKIFHKDKNLRYVSCNNNFARDLNIKSDEIVGKTDYDFFTEELAEKYRADDKRIMESGKTEDIEENYILNGQKMIVHTVKTPIRDENGNTTGVLGIFWDITEQKRAEEALRQSEERYRSLVDNAKDIIFTLSTDGTFASLNPWFETVTGWSRSDWLGKTFPGIIHPDDLPFVRELFQHILLGEVSPSSFELRVLSKSGMYIIMDFVVTPQVLDGEVVKVLGICRDITERKRVEEALKLSEEKYRTLIDNIQDGVFIIQDAKIQFANEAFARIAGYTVEEITGKDFQELVSPEDLEIVTDRYHRRQAGEDIPKEYEFRMLHRDGTRIIVNMNVGLINYQGRVASMGTVKNITERKRAEVELQKSEEQFRTSVENMLDAFGIYSAVRDQSNRIIDFRVEYVNDAACEMNLMAKGEQIGKRLLELLPAHRDSGLFDAYCQVVETGKPLIKESLIYEDFYVGKHLSRAFDIRAAKLGDGFVAAWRDVTERKRAEEALRESEDRYRRLVDFSTFGIAIHCNHKIVYANPAALKIFGASKPEELIGIPVLQVIHPDYHEIVKERISKQKHGEIAPLIEEKLLRLDGSPVDVEIVSIPFTYMGKQAMYGIFQEITERKRAEEEILRRSQIQASLNKLLQISLEDISLDKILEKVIDHLTSIPWLALEPMGGIWMADDDSDVLVLKAQRGLPDSLQTVCARVPFGKCICGRAASSGKIEFVNNIDEHHEYIYDGITSHGHYCVPLISSGRVLGIINLYLKEGHHRDQKEEEILHAIADVLVGIIQRKQAEEALSRSNGFSKTILDSMNDALCIIDVQDFKIAGFNSVFLREFGQRGEDVLGRACYSITHQRLEPCEHPDDICPLLETVKTGKHSVVEHLHYGRDGKKIYVEVSTSPILDETGRITQVVHVSRDITERKLAEERLKQVNTELKKADELKTQFLSIVSHELRTPITPMNAQLQMILAGYFGVVTEQQMKSLEMILRNTTRLDRLIGDVLDISKLEAGVMRFIMARANLNEVVENAVETMRPQAQDKKITITLRGDKIPEIVFDRDKITQVIVNLINNAIKFTDSGGRINIGLSGNTDHAVVSVTDNGIGIKKEDTEKLFKPFQQVDSSYTRKYEGTGLGLAICRGIITYHGGKIWIESEFGKGSVFRFTLPYKSEIKEEKVELDLLEKASVNKRDVK
ncbi:MAG: PAS domain S-box protein [Candidatus Methanoperedens sp.]|nr:PAS domain S-box protein [Candidatus Methanoperedens sp.]